MASLGLNEILDRIAAAALRSGRDPAEITLVAVTKSAADEQVRAAYDAGHRDFGENRAKALVARAALLPIDARWHAIGRVQGNKVRKVRPVARLLHSLDRPDLARYWAGAEGPAPPVLVQVNVGREPQKAGAMPEAAPALVEMAIGLGLDVRGLMTIAPMTDDPEEARPCFRQLASLRDLIRVDHPDATELSMGMTDDFEVAVEEGATLLRVGRAIFGPSGELSRG
jgi:pyridoxal phosphate enzyme (YggS family)